MTWYAKIRENLELIVNQSRNLNVVPIIYAERKLSQNEYQHIIDVLFRDF